MKWLSKENAREKFKRLAEYRVNQAVHYIGLIGNLSNDRAYDFTGEDSYRTNEGLNW